MNCRMHAMNLKNAYKVHEKYTGGGVSMKVFIEIRGYSKGTH
jgi:hypothetical protein